MAIKHVKVSVIADDAAAVSRGEVVPTDWNADHTIEDGSIVEAKLSLSDITTNNATSLKHGFLPKLSGNASDVLKGNGTFGALAATGDVVGPASAVDNALVRFDTTTGKLIQNSSATLSDAGAISLPLTVAATSTDGLVLSTDQVATVGAPKFSPRIRWLASGWKTNSTAGPQTVEFAADVQPIQGAANPSGELWFTAAVNGAALVNVFRIVSDGNVKVAQGLSLGGAANMMLIPTAGNIEMRNGSGVGMAYFLNTRIALPAASIFGWSSTSTITTAHDTGMSRNAAGVTEFNNGTAGTFRDIKIRNLIGTGSISSSIVTKTANYTATINDHTINCDATAGVMTITLPASSTATGLILCIKKIDVTIFAVTIDANGTETIDGALTMALGTQWDCMIIQCDGSNWFVISVS